MAGSADALIQSADKEIVMKRIPILVLSLSVLAGSAALVRVTAHAEPGGPPPADGGGAGGPGGPRGDRGGPGDGRGEDRPRPPAGFHLLPRHVTEELDLTDEQTTAIAQLEKETKEKLEKILTPEQFKMLQQMRPPGPPGGQNGMGGPGGPDGQGGPGGR